MSLYEAEGIVLRVRNLGEADKIITVLTEQRGKLEAVARGSRRPRNRLVGATQLFSHIALVCFRGRSLDNVSQVEIRESFRLLREDLIPLAYATYLAELTDQMVNEGDPQPGLVGLLLTALHLLQGGSEAEAVRRMYELKFLALLGYRPRLDDCAGCGAATSGGRWSGEAGGVVCGQCDETGRVVTEGTLESLRHLLVAEPRQAVQLRLGGTVATEVAALLSEYIGLRLPRRLKSLDFLESLR